MNESIFDLEPRLVVLLIGVNDLGRRYKPDAVVKNIFDIISEIREVLPDTEIILQSVYPVNEKWGKAYFKRVAPGVIEVNNALSAGEAEYGYTYVDVYSELVDERGSLPDDLTEDGLHPNAECYEIISAFLYPKILEVLNKA